MHRLGIVALVTLTLLPMLGLGSPRTVRALANPASAAPFVVRPDGARGPLVAYDQQTGNEIFRLPPGMISADGTRYFAATPSEHAILLETYDTTTGRALRTKRFEGDWTIGGVSHSGRWVVLAHQPGRLVAADSTDADLVQTAILVVDAGRGSVTHEITLDGDFAVEMISANGDALFLIEHLAAGPGEPAPYLVRVYDLALDYLDPNPLRDKRFLDELMTGLAWDGLASPDGQWLLTLYVNTARDRAFIHALNLRERYAICLDLPALGGSVEQLAAYSLTLAPDGRRAYAINPVLGVVAEINLVDVTIGRSTTFDPVPATSSTLAVVSSPTATPSSSLPAATSGASSRPRAAVDRLPSVVAPVVGLSVSTSGDQLLVAAAEGPIARIDAAGNLLAFSERGAA